MSLWPHQIRAIEDTLAAIARGVRRLLVTCPTGGGKTRVACELIGRWLAAGLKVVLYTNRRILVDQLSGVLAAAGLEHGVRAAGHSTARHLDLQVSSIQTEQARTGEAVYARAKRRGADEWDALEAKDRCSWELHAADRVLVDEAHLQGTGASLAILSRHAEAGAHVVGLTATPLDLGHAYDELLVAGVTSELRACGALVPCLHYGCDEPDLKAIGRVQTGEDLTEKQAVKAVMTPTIWGRVFDWWRKLNPDAMPTILFGPGVGESRWFAEQFEKKGVAAAHIDGAEVCVNGQVYRRTRGEDDPVKDILEASRDGRIKVLCNRFVLREGIDAPWLAHGVFATVFGSLQSYLQAGGRLLRSHPGMRHITLQDHGGNWWRHGSLNADRRWELTDTAAMVSALREQRLRDKREKEPACCPRCRRVLNGVKCPCGYEIKPGEKSRPVIEQDGTLKEMKGDVFKPRRLSKRPDAARVWERMYYRARNKGMTFRQAEALFAQENNWGWPPRTLPLMPTADADWFARVRDVPVENLTPKG